MSDGAHLPFHVEQWDASGVHLEELVAAARNLLIGRAAFRAAVALYPRARLTLRHHARVIAEHAPGEIPSEGRPPSGRSRAD